MFAVSVEVPALQPVTETSPAEQSPAASDAILVVVVLAVVMVCLCALVLICRRRRQSLVSGACSRLKYNIVEGANLYYFKVEEKRSDDLVKIGSEN
jgi:hypothetical protein